MTQMDLPWLRGHPEKYERALGMGDGETRRGQAADVFGRVQGRGIAAGGRQWQVYRGDLELGLGETALLRWVQEVAIDGGHGSLGALTTSERAELVQLRRENRRLRMQREILKKATAFFARESV